MTFDSLNYTFLDCLNYLQAPLCFRYPMQTIHCLSRQKRQSLSEREQEGCRRSGAPGPQPVNCCLISWQQTFMTGWLSKHPPANRTLASRDIRNLPWENSNKSVRGITTWKYGQREKSIKKHPSPESLSMVGNLAIKPTKGIRIIMKSPWFVSGKNERC